MQDEQRRERQLAALQRVQGLRQMQAGEHLQMLIQKQDMCRQALQRGLATYQQWLESCQQQVSRGMPLDPYLHAVRLDAQRQSNQHVDHLRERLTHVTSEQDVAVQALLSGRKQQKVFDRARERLRQQIISRYQSQETTEALDAQRRLLEARDEY